MSVFTQFTSGTGGSIPAFSQTFLSSGTFTAPISGWYGFYVVGAGGGGGAASANMYDPANYGAAQGGTAGGSAVKFAYVASGTAIVVTIGTGGAGANLAQANQTNAGSAGNATTVVGGNVNITCNAGNGGGAGLGNTVINAKTGGTATGGDYNWTGGGQTVINSASSKYGLPYGGSAPGVFATGFTPAGAAGGGTGNTNGLPYGYVNYGGNTTNNTILNNQTPNVNSVIAPPIIFGIQMNGKPNTINQTDNAGIGAGGAFATNSFGAGGVTGGTGGLLGGGGAAFGSAANGYGIGTGGIGGRGGGGGAGYCGTYNAASWAYGGAGGAGFVQIGFLGQ